MANENRETRTIAIQETREVTLFPNPITEALYRIVSRFSGSERVEEFRKNRMMDVMGRRFNQIMCMCAGRDVNIYFNDVRFVADEAEADQVQAQVAQVQPIDVEDVGIFTKKMGGEYRLADGDYLDLGPSLRVVVSPARNTGGLQTQDIVTIAGLVFRRSDGIVVATKDQEKGQQHSLATLHMANSLLGLTAETLKREHIQETGCILSRIELASD